MIKNEARQRIKKMFPGYVLDYQGTEIRYNKKYITLKVYLDNGQGMGNFYIPDCDNCVDDLDVVLYIEHNFPKIYPELFTKE